jgi:hypothetical protein
MQKSRRVLVITYMAMMAIEVFAKFRMDVIIDGGTVNENAST